MGSFTLRSGSDDGPPIAGRYSSIAFTPSTGIYLFTWLPIQFIPEYDDIATPDGQTRPAATVYFTISRCPGDFRLPDSTSSDPALHRGCRKISNSGAIATSRRRLSVASAPDASRARAAHVYAAVPPRPSRAIRWVHGGSGRRHRAARSMRASGGD